MIIRLPRWLRRRPQVLSVRSPEAWYEVVCANPGRGDAVPVLGEAEALGVARRVSSRGEMADVFLVLGSGSRRLVASFADGQLVPGAATQVPAAAKAAQAPVSRLRGTDDVRAAAVQYPGGIHPLPAAATSGGLLRPRRLLHPDGTRLDCRPAGRTGPQWSGVADGVVPGGDQAGWLQVVRCDSSVTPGGLVTMHPALISPAGVDPAGCMNRRQRRRFDAFDLAEAAGAAAAALPAVLVDAGDYVRADDPPDIMQVTQTALDCGYRGVSVRILAEPSGGGSYLRIIRDSELVEVILPVIHPAETGPQARRLFAPGCRTAPVPVPPRPGLFWTGSR